MCVYIHSCRCPSKRRSYPRNDARTPPAAVYRGPAISMDTQLPAQSQEVDDGTKGKVADDELSKASPDVDDYEVPAHSDPEAGPSESTAMTMRGQIIAEQSDN